MPEPLADDRLAEIRAREAAATAGPWDLYPQYGSDFYAYIGGCHIEGVGDLSFGNGEQADADREFTLAARQDVPDLLAEVDRLRRRMPELTRRRNEDLELRAELITARRPVPFELGNTLVPAVRWLLAETDRLRAEAVELRTQLATAERQARDLDRKLANRIEITEAAGQLLLKRGWEIEGRKDHAARLMAEIAELQATVAQLRHQADTEVDERAVPA